MGYFLLLCSVAILIPGYANQQWSNNCSIAKGSSIDYEQMVKQNTNIKYPTEAEISRTGNYYGLVPQSYDLRLSFSNATHYNGTVAIGVLVTDPTRIIAINIDLDRIKYNYNDLIIEIDSSHIQGTFNCVANFTYDNATKTLFVELTAKLWKNYKYTIHLKNFQSHVYDVRSQKGAAGLQQTITAAFGAVFTDFAPNNARTVFPCMDHITLRAKFKLCVEHGETYTVASTTKAVGDPAALGNEFWVTCFEETKPIPTYVFSFSLMDGYMTHDYDNFMHVIVLSPLRYVDHINLMVDYADKAIEYMSRVTGKELPFGKLQLLLVFGNATMSTNNAGLVPVPGEQVLANVEPSHFYKGFFRAIVNQWLGPITTVSHWGEVCLQEGLAEYFNWFLLEQHCNQAIAVKARAISKKHAVPKEFWITDDFNGVLTKDALQKCYTFSPLFYNTVVQFYNIYVLEVHLKTLIGRKPYSFAGLDDWDTFPVITAPTATPDWKPMAGYISGWFKAGSYVTVKISYYKFLLIGECVPRDSPNCNLVIPLRVHTSFSDVPFRLIIHNGNGSTVLPDTPEWVFVEPVGSEMVVKMYNWTSYYEIFSAVYNNIPSRFQISWNGDLLDGFCSALTNNSLPIENDYKPIQWKEIFRYGNLLNASCSCCLLPEDTVRFCDSVTLCSSIKIRHRVQLLDVF